jgi:outer membrane protein assembly factor BamB
MRCAVWLFVIAAIVELAAGCSSSYDMADGPKIPAHTDRIFAPMSLPAFAADGSLYVANGDTLLHFAADGTRLGSSALPVDLGTYAQENFVWPRGYATLAGDVFIALDAERIGLLGAEQQFAWINKCGDIYTAPVPMAHGLLVERGNDLAPSVAYIDRAGVRRWSMPGFVLWPNVVQVDEQGRAYFCDLQSLSVMPDSGVELLHASLAQAGPYDQVSLLQVRAERVLVHSANIVTCYDLNGEALWEFTPPAGLDYFCSGHVLSAERFVLQYSAGLGDDASRPLLIVDAVGHLVRQLPDNPVWRVRSTSATGFIAVVNDGKPSVLGLFNAEGEQLWSRPLPQPVYPQSVPLSEHRFAVYPLWTGPVFGADGNIYYTVDNTLYSVDPQGNLMWQARGAVYHDEWYPDTYVGNTLD